MPDTNRTAATGTRTPVPTTSWKFTTVSELVAKLQQAYLAWLLDALPFVPSIDLGPGLIAGYRNAVQQLADAAFAYDVAKAALSNCPGAASDARALRALKQLLDRLISAKAVCEALHLWLVARQLERLHQQDAAGSPNDLTLAADFLVAELVADIERKPIRASGGWFGPGP